MEHSSMCKDVTKDVLTYFDKRIGELFDRQREWMDHELKIIRAEITNIKKLNGSSK